MPRARIVGFILVCLLAVTPVLAQEETHVVQPGENLYRIAVRYGVDVESLARTNSIANTWHIYAGQVLTIPSAEAIAEAEAAGESPAMLPATHIVQRGEYLASIARLYALTPEELAERNNIVNPNLIYAGQELIIALGESVTEAPAAETVVEVVEEAAEEVVEAAAEVVEAAPEAVVEEVAEAAEAAEEVAVEAAADVVEVVEDAVEEVVEVAAAPAQPETIHTVQRGEHLATIANRYGVSWLAVAQANNIFNADLIYAGQQLKIPGSTPSPDAVTELGDFGLVNIPAAPPAAVTTGRSILVDLSDSRIYAYEDGVLVRNVLASTGLPATPTVRGDFNVYLRYEAQTMSGPGYYLPDVPYVMYFYSGYAIHGTYWHNNFGVPMSHGCVNLPNAEAEWFFNWASMGTPVRVQY